MSKHTILIVDDEQGPRETLKAVLASLYNVLTADSAQAALELFKEHKPSLVITDVRMPGRDGIQLASDLRKLDSSLAIIVFTGHGDLETARSSMQVGVNDFLQKPASLNIIRQVVARNLEDALQRRDEALKRKKDEKLAAITTTSGTFIHDLNNPLSAILMGVDFLTEALQQPTIDLPSVNRVLGLIRQNGLKCSTLIKYWQQMSREITVTKQTFDLLGLLLEVCNSIPKPSGVLVKLPETSLSCWADRFQMGRVLTNLISNAFQAVGEKGQIHVSIESAPKATLIHIRDNGPGIPPEIKAKLFQPYQTSKGENGNGLGLFLSQKIVVAHGGTITCETEPNKGTVFTITLPTK